MRNPHVWDQVALKKVISDMLMTAPACNQGPAMPLIYVKPEKQARPGHNSQGRSWRKRFPAAYTGPVTDMIPEARDPAKSDETLADVLCRHFLFSALDELQRARILAHVHRRQFDCGEHLFMQDSEARVFFLLLSGAIKLYRVSADGQEKIMRFIRPGQSFAEGVMFMDKPRYPVHGQAIEPGALASIESAAFLDVLRASFDTCRAVMAQMTRRIQDHWDEIEALTLQNSHYRMVHYLLGLVPEGRRGRVRVEFPTYKATIAAQLAMTPETFSRELRALSDAHLIEVHGRTVDIVDPGALLQGTASLHTR
ncbi:MAG: Crp/Fnr family transcriptional regulator [Acidiferrobacteraceae bacterium]